MWNDDKELIVGIYHLFSFLIFLSYYSYKSGVKFNDEGMQFHDTLPLHSELFETEVVREVNDIGTETQVLEDADSTAGEGAEVTEVLSSDGEDQLSDGGTSLCKVKDSNAEIEIKDGKGGSEKRKLICSYYEATNDILVDSDASTEDEYSSGQSSTL